MFPVPKHLSWQDMKYEQDLWQITNFEMETVSVSSAVLYKKRAYPVQRAPTVCEVWGRVSVASLTLARAMRGDRDSNPGLSGHRR